MRERCLTIPTVTIGADSASPDLRVWSRQPTPVDDIAAAGRDDVLLHADDTRRGDEPARAHGAIPWPL